MREREAREREGVGCRSAREGRCAALREVAREGSGRDAARSVGEGEREGEL